MEQKVIQVGNSLAITLPRHFVKARKLKAGQRVFVDADAEFDMVHVRTQNPAIARITPEFKQWLDEFTDKYAGALKELAKR